MIHFRSCHSFFERLEKHRKNVHYHFNKLLKSRDSTYSDDPVAGIETELEAVWQGLLETEHRREVLVEAGYENPDEVLRLLDSHTLQQMM